MNEKQKAQVEAVVGAISSIIGCALYAGYVVYAISFVVDGRVALGFALLFVLRLAGSAYRAVKGVTE